LKKFQVVGGIISPVSDGYGKESLVSAEHRVEMCKLACEDNPLLTVDGWEAMNPSWTSTLQVLKHFKSEFDSENLGQIRLCLLAGSDLLDGIDNPTIWNPNEVSELLDSFGIAVIERNPAVPLINKLFTSNVLYPHITNIFIISQFVPNDVSSSKIRLLLKRGHSIRYLTSDRVIEYIYKNNLYSK
jgi:nicotinamide mononucleotide adenylyltransferase